jgi:signal transduction histidine kinase
VQLALTSHPSRSPQIALGVVFATAGGVLAVLVLRTARASPEIGYGAWSAKGAAELVLPGLAVLAVALESLRRHRRDRSALLLALAALASFLPELSLPGTRPAIAFTVGLALAWATPPLVTHLALRYLSSALPTIARSVQAAGYIAVVVGLGVVPTLVFDPVQTGCGQCATNVILVHASTRLLMVFERIGIVLTLAWVVVSLALMVYRLARATPAARRLLWPVLVPAAVLVGFFGVELALSLRRAYLSTGDLDRRLWLAGQAALVAVALGFLVRWLRTHRAQFVLARDVVELSDPSALETVAERLSVVLDDPTLELGYAVGEPSRLVDARGAPVELTPQAGRAITVLHESRATLRHRQGLLDDPTLVAEIARAARLALANERLRADAQARLALLQASRKRIIEAADDERQRLERNLHDGAQQRLVSLAVALRAARSKEGGQRSLLDEAQAEVANALDELRVIARGIYPAVLAELGLAAAIEALAETAPVPLKVGELPRERLDPVVEATAYFVAAEIVHDPAVGRVRISARRDGDSLLLAVSTDVPTGALTRLSDRVGAAAGTIHSRPLADEVILEVEMPCGS